MSDFKISENMRNIRKYVLGITVSLCLAQCDVLDIEPTSAYNENVAYASLNNVDLYVKGLYTVLYNNADINSAFIMDDGATDLLKHSRYGVADGNMNKFFYQQNFVTEQNNFRSNWSAMYTRIRELNEYFYDRSRGYGNQLDPDEMKIRTAEVRFLRAMAYQELVIRHGGVVLRIAEDAVDGPEERAKARSSEAECWDFIINEYQKAANDLPLKWTGENVGRITKGAAYGMKARAALYAKRWSDAIDACDAVLELNYRLLPGKTINDYNKIFTAVHNSELILPVLFQQGQTAKQHKFDYYVCPPYDWKQAGTTKGTVGALITPSEEYASSFDIKVNGSYESFNWDNLRQYNNEPFANREPRFYASILYNGAEWKGRTLQLYVGGTDGYMDFSTIGQDALHKSTTGYLIRKFVSDDTNINFTTVHSGQYWIEMRLAEIYLIRSEAYAQQNNFDKAYADLKIIRDRVGLPTLTQKNNWDEYLQDLSKERICELGMEGHRYFDLIRWGIAESTLDHKRLHGIKITKSGAKFNYQRVECDTQDRLFPKKYTIFPIPYKEIQDNKYCVQNDLWK